MRLNKKTILQTLFFALIGIGLVVWRYKAMSIADQEAMFAAFDSFKWSWALPIFLVGLFSHYVRAKRWELQFKALEINVRSFHTFGAVMFGYLTNIFIPRLGEITKCTYIVKNSDADVDKVIGTVIAERLWDTICFGLLTIITLIVQLPILLPYAQNIGQSALANLYNNEGAISWIKVFGIIIALILIIAVSILVYNKIKHTKLGNFIDGIKKGLQSIYQVPNKLLFIVYTILLWGSYTLVAILVLKAIPSTENLPLIAGLSIITFGTFAMIVPAPGSIAYPIIVAPILTLYGTSMGVGQGYGWINWANQNLTILLLSVGMLLLNPFFKNKKNDRQIIDTQK